MFAQLAIGVLGVIIVTSEYATGMIRTTFAAVPNRRLVLGVKAALFAGITAVVGVVSSFVAFFIGQAILSGKAPHAAIGDPGVLRSVVGAGLYLAVLGVLALDLGVIIRRTAGAIAAVLGIVLVLPVVVGALGSSFNAVSKFLPSTAGQAIFHTAAPGQTCPRSRRGPGSQSSSATPSSPSPPAQPCLRDATRNTDHQGARDHGASAPPRQHCSVPLVRRARS